MTFDKFVGPGSQVCGLGQVEDVEGAELCDVARAAALSDGWSLCQLHNLGIELRAYKGDRHKSVVALDVYRRERPAVGCYEGLSLWVAPPWRRLGLGTRLVLETARLRGGSPVASEPAVAFSAAGMRVHRCAHTLLTATIGPEA